MRSIKTDRRRWKRLRRVAFLHISASSRSVLPSLHSAPLSPPPVYYTSYCALHACNAYALMMLQPQTRFDRTAVPILYWVSGIVMSVYVGSRLRRAYLAYEEEILDQEVFEFRPYVALARALASLSLSLSLSKRPL